VSHLHIVEVGVVALIELVGRAAGEGVDAVAQLAGADLAAAPGCKLLLKLAQLPAQLGLVGPARILVELIAAEGRRSTSGR
jgi:hypothetical protein